MSVKRIGNGLFRVVVRIRVRGRIMHRQATITGTRDSAKAKELSIKAELRAGTGDCSLKLKTFGEVVQYYQDRMPAEAKYNFERLKHDLGHVKLSELADRFDLWFMGLKKEVSKQTGKKLANRTINDFLCWSKVVLNFAIKNRVMDGPTNLVVCGGGNRVSLSSNPLAHISKLPTVPRDESISAEEKERFLAICYEKSHIGPVAQYLLQVPCRRAEVIEMRREDVDMINNVVRIRNGMTKEGDGIYKPIPPDMVEYFRSIPIESEFVFYRKRGTRYMSLGIFKRSWEKCRELAGLPNLHIHDSRHISATDMANRGTPDRVVMAVAGWKTDMLSTYYHRDTLNSMKLVKFSPQREQPCEQSNSEVG